MIGLLNGMRVVVNQHAGELVANRPHKKRRGQSAAYHARINKKWRKRFGTRLKPGAWMVGGNTLVVHPIIYEQMKCQVAAQRKPWEVGNAFF